MPQVTKKVAEEYLENIAKRKPKKRSRFGGENKVVLPGMPTAIPANLSNEQLSMYLLQLQIEDYTRRIREEDIGSANKPFAERITTRSPSPEPVYDSEGKRVNTRQFRVRRKLEEKRTDLIAQILKLNPTYSPPTDYRMSAGRITEKVVIPQDDHPDINFVGLLIGPRGNTLKMLERETGARIIIRGKGSVKEGKSSGGYQLPGEDEPLHAYITGCTDEQVKRAQTRIEQIIREGVELPESENDLRKNQLRELALLNGTLHDDKALQLLRQRQESDMIITNTILCSRCGGAGHITSDCIVDLSTVSMLERNMGKVDNEYVALMNEIGQQLPVHLQNAGIKQYMGPATIDAYGRQLMLSGNQMGIMPDSSMFPMMMTPVPYVVPGAIQPRMAFGNNQRVPPPPPTRPSNNLDIPLPPS